jgi:hypothetical protein
VAVDVIRHVLDKADDDALRRRIDALEPPAPLPEKRIPEVPWVKSGAQLRSTS